MLDRIAILPDEAAAGTVKQIREIAVDLDVGRDRVPDAGVELVVSSVEAKAKLSQNRSDEDRAGVAAGLAADGVDPSRLVVE